VNIFCFRGGDGKDLEMEFEYLVIKNSGKERNA